MFACIFPYYLSFPIKMNAKMQKIKPDLIFFVTDKRFGGSEKTFTLKNLAVE